MPCCDWSRSSETSSIKSQGTQVMDLFPRTPLDLHFGSERSEPIRYRFHGQPVQAPLALHRAEAQSKKPRSFLSPCHMVDFMKMENSPFSAHQLASDLSHQDPYFHLWLDQVDQLDLKFFQPSQQALDNKAFLDSWGQTQFTASAKMEKDLRKAYPALALRFFYWRNNPEALLIAQIHLALLETGRPVTQPQLPWLKDQYLRLTK